MRSQHSSSRAICRNICWPLSAATSAGYYVNTSAKYTRGSPPTATAAGLHPQSTFEPFRSVSFLLVQCLVEVSRHLMGKVHTELSMTRKKITALSVSWQILPLRYSHLFFPSYFLFIDFHFAWCVGFIDGYLDIYVLCLIVCYNFFFYSLGRNKTQPRIFTNLCNCPMYDLAYKIN